MVLRMPGCASPVGQSSSSRAAGILRALKRRRLAPFTCEKGLVSAAILAKASAGSDDSPIVRQNSANKRPQLVAFAKRASSVAASGLILLAAGSCGAADFAKVGVCLLGNCPVPLAKCIADKTCAENIVCLQNCNGRPDETECQIRCGDLYASPAVEEFNKCAVTEKKCVPQRKDKNEFPVPPDDVLDNSFDLSKFQGQWAITAGLNNLFDTFDCQVHQFRQDSERRLHADIDWRIPKNNGDFLERHAVQTFDQDPKRPGYLHNGNNDFLSYTDDWYILGFKPDAYAVIYYRGNNDAWAGYGGATVYSRDLAFPEQHRREIEAALEKVGLRLGDFRQVDNSCPPHPETSRAADVVGAVEDINPDRKPTAAPPIDIDESKSPRERAGIDGPLRRDFQDS